MGTNILNPFEIFGEAQSILDFSPTQWLKAEVANFVFRPSSSEFVKQWLDISGNNNHTDEQTIESAQPTWNGSRLNFKVVTYFKNLSSIDWSEHTFFMKAKVNSINNARSPVLASAPAPDEYFIANFDTTEIHSVYLSQTVTTAETYIAEWTYGIKASVANSANGFRRANDTEGAHTENTSDVLDQYIGSSNNFRFSDSFIDEYVYFNRVLSLADFQSVFALLGT